MIHQRFATTTSSGTPREHSTDSHLRRIAAALSIGLAALVLSACSGIALEEGEEMEWIGEHEAALMNDGSGPGGDDCTSALQNCYLVCTVDRYPESKDSPNNLNAMLREGCLDSCDAANRTCSAALTHHGLDRIGVGGLDLIDVRPTVNPKLRAAAATTGRELLAQ